MHLRGLLVVVSILIACGTEGGVSASAYDQSCNADGDCAVAGGLDVASNNTCTRRCGDAVNGRDAARMESDVEARLDDCSQVVHVDCVLLGAMCVQNKCTTYECGDPVKCPAPPH